MAQGEYKGKRVLVTLDQEVYDLLVLSAERNGIPVATRARQIITVGIRNEGQQEQIQEPSAGMIQPSPQESYTQPKQEETEINATEEKSTSSEKAQESKIIIGQAWKK